MALSDKNIVITPNISNTADPKIVFSGANSSVAAQNITVAVYPQNNGTLSFEGSSGQLFSVTNDLSNTLFTVADISGIPSVEAYANGQVSLARFGGNVQIGSALATVSVPGKVVLGNTTISANGGVGTAGQVLTSGASGNVYWSTQTTMMQVRALPVTNTVVTNTNLLGNVLMPRAANLASIAFFADTVGTGSYGYTISKNGTTIVSNTVADATYQTIANNVVQDDKITINLTSVPTSANGLMVVFKLTS